MVSFVLPGRNRCLGLPVRRYEANVVQRHEEFLL